MDRQNSALGARDPRVWGVVGGVALLALIGYGLLADAPDPEVAVRETDSVLATDGLPASGDAAEVASSQSVDVPSSVLAAVPVLPEYSGGYERSDFGSGWIDADGDGCDTRREVLISESLSPVEVGSACSIAGGSWLSPYSSQRINEAGALDIDHVVPLKEAWESGAWSWSEAQRRGFANDLADPRSLLAVESSTNRSKGYGDLAEWLPPDSTYWCEYTDDWLGIKLRWGLSMDQREASAASAILTDCR